jgi:hypothetical protein
MTGVPTSLEDDLLNKIPLIHTQGPGIPPKLCVIGSLRLFHFSGHILRNWVSGDNVTFCCCVDLSKV